MKKRILCGIMVVFCLLSGMINAVSAANIGYDISYWYSNSNDIGIWSSDFLDVYVGTSSTYSSLTIENLKSYLGTAKTSWSCTGVSFNYVSQSSSADLLFSGITRSEATGMAIPTNVVGITYSYAPTQMATLYYGAQEKGLCRIDLSRVYLIESDQVSTTAKAKKVAVHEIGHALGYFGHYDSGSVMTTYYESMTSTTPSTAERNHLGQLH